MEKTQAAQVRDTSYTGGCSLKKKKKKHKTKQKQKKRKNRKKKKNPSYHVVLTRIKSVGWMLAEETKNTVPCSAPPPRAYAIYLGNTCRCGHNRPPGGAPGAFRGCQTRLRARLPGSRCGARLQSASASRCSSRKLRAAAAAAAAGDAVPGAFIR